VEKVTESKVVSFAPIPSPSEAAQSPPPAPPANEVAPAAAKGDLAAMLAGRGAGPGKVAGRGDALGGLFAGRGGPGRGAGPDAAVPKVVASKLKSVINCPFEKTIC
jgi:hypothetical protein